MKRYHPNWPVLLCLTAFIAATSSNPRKCLAEATETSTEASDLADSIRLPRGFHAELVYEPDLDSEGSWVAMTVDSRGRLIAADQFGKLYRLSPAPLGTSSEQTRAEPLQVELGSAQGLLATADSLYVMVNSSQGKYRSGLYRVSDTDSDDEYDKIEKLRGFLGAGEHGPHAVTLGPAGKSLYFCAGNASPIPFYDRTLVPPDWREDQILPRLDDPGATTGGKPAPGGWIARTDLEGKNLTLLSVGYRNEYDLAFNAEGDLFTVDADMEWDLGTPWYRPTRVCHATCGSDYGWRAGNGKWRPEWPDTLPPAAELGTGSPSGIVFGSGTNYPEKYQRMLFVGDWSQGAINAAALTPQGASYRGEVESFASAAPLPVTDIVVRPQDGCLYFAVGGRRIQSAVYRIVYDDSSKAGSLESLSLEGRPQIGEAKVLQSRSGDDEPTVNSFRTLRWELERLQGNPQAGAVDRLWEPLGSKDRFVRYAARVALEFQPVDQWLSRAVKEPDPQRRLTALVAAARTAKPESFSEVWQGLQELSYQQLSTRQQIEYLRIVELAWLRLGPLPGEMRKAMIAQLDPLFPSGDPRVDHLLSHLLAALQAPDMAERLLLKMEEAPTTAQAFDAAVAAASLRSGWTSAQRRRQLQWYLAAAKQSGRTPLGYLTSARQRSLLGFTEEQRSQLAKLADQRLVAKTARFHAQQRPFVKKRRLQELIALAKENDASQPPSSPLTPEQEQRGQYAFAAANCAQCHRLGGLGATIGPDLTAVGRRFNTSDLLRAIVEPDAQISDRFLQTALVVKGRVIVGRVVSRRDDELTISTNPLDPASMVKVSRSDIDEQTPSELSMMPSGLLDTLTEEEILDLLRYLQAQQ